MCYSNRKIHCIVNIFLQFCNVFPSEILISLKKNSNVSLILMSVFFILYSVKGVRDFYQMNLTPLSLHIIFLNRNFPSILPNLFKVIVSYLLFVLSIVRFQIPQTMQNFY